MSSPLSVDSYLELLRRSGLVPTEKLRRVMDALESETGERPTDTGVISQALINDKLITPWHNKMLLKGLWRGFFLGRYKLLKELGAGGMSSVYLAEHSLLRRKVAVKVLHQKRASNRSHLTRFYRESRSTAALDHPNIVRVFDFDSDGKFHYLVMEYVDGTNLQELIDTKHPLPFESIAGYLGQAASGLCYAHEQGLIHRDIKPANLLVTSRGVVKITDLGLARLSKVDGPSLTVDEGSVLGTVDYLAPEQALDSHNVDAKVDIYSLGCTLYFALTGSAPFPTGTMAIRLMKHQTEEAPAVSQFRPDAPMALAELCQRMMHKLPEKRPTAVDVRNELQSWLASLSGGNVRRGGIPGDTLDRASVSTASLPSVQPPNEESPEKPVHQKSDESSIRVGGGEQTPGSSLSHPPAPGGSSIQYGAEKGPPTGSSSMRGSSIIGESGISAAGSSISQQGSSISSRGDKLSVRCHNCSTLLYAARKHAGKRAKCPNCGTMLRVPNPANT